MLFMIFFAARGLVVRVIWLTGSNHGDILCSCKTLYFAFLHSIQLPKIHCTCISKGRLCHSCVALNLLKNYVKRMRVCAVISYLRVGFSNRLFCRSARLKPPSSQPTELLALDKRILISLTSFSSKAFGDLAFIQ